jgi:hypothetical protein
MAEALDISIPNLGFSIEYSALVIKVRDSNIQLVQAEIQKICLIHVYETFSFNRSQIPSKCLLDLEAKISNFVKIFLKKYRMNSRMISRVLSDSWSKCHLSLPSSVVSWLQGNALGISETTSSGNVEALFHHLEGKSDSDSEEVLPRDSQVVRIPRLELCNFMHENKLEFTNYRLQLPVLMDFILSKISKHMADIPETCLDDLFKKLFHNFLPKVQQNYAQVSRKYASFVCTSFASGNFELPSSLQSFLKDFNPAPPTKLPTPFGEKSKRSQFRATQKLRASFEPEVIFQAAAQNLSQAGQKDARFVTEKVNSSTGLTAAKARAAITAKDNSRPSKISPVEALSFILQHNLTKATYEAMAATSKAHNANIWPSYPRVQEAKFQCRPDEVIFSDHCAIVPLQNLLDQTVKRMLESDPNLKDQLFEAAAEQDSELHATLYFKYGFDGSGSHHRPMQPDSQGDIQKVKSLMLSQLVVLQIDANVGECETVFFTNHSPNNPHFCRPLRISFESESSAAILAEHNRLKSELEELLPYEVSQSPKIHISYKGLETMVDGKVVVAVTNNNTSICTICDKGSTEMASNVGPFDPVSDERLLFGISPLHFLLRVFEALLHIAYKQEVKQFRVKKADKPSVAANTLRVKEAFERKLGLIVDQRREGGFGNTNTGNVARKAFANADTFAQICGVSTILVSNLDVICRTLASSHNIDADKFEEFCNATLAQYMIDCPWYNIPPTLHKVLVHGADIIRATPLPIGVTSEEGSESNTKFCRKYYQNHTRKISSLAALQDLFHRMMDVSDPLVRSLTPEPETQSSEMPPDMRALLILPSSSSVPEAVDTLSIANISIDNSNDSNSSMEMNWQ